MGGGLVWGWILGEVIVFSFLLFLTVSFVSNCFFCFELGRVASIGFCIEYFKKLHMEMGVPERRGA